MSLIQKCTNDASGSHTNLVVTLGVYDIRNVLHNALRQPDNVLSSHSKRSRRSLGDQEYRHEHVSLYA